MISIEEYNEHKVVSKCAPLEKQTPDLFVIEKSMHDNNYSLSAALDQLNIDRKTYNSIIESETKPYESYLPGLHEMNEYIEEHQCSVYEMCNHYGIHTSYYDRLTGDDDGCGEICSGLTINIGNKALIRTVISEFSQRSKLLGLSTHGYNTAQYGDSVKNAVKEHYENGKEAFLEALGVDERLNSGESYDEVAELARTSLKEFISKYIGPDNKKARDDLRKLISSKQ